MIVARVDAEGEIKCMYVPGIEVPAEGTSSEDSTQTNVHINGDIDDWQAYAEITYYKDGAWKSRSKKPNSYYTWKDETWNLNSTALWETIRSERDNSLYASDWRVMPDSPLTDEKKAEWVTYRQALRDVPDSQKSVTDHAAIVWPDEPS